MFASALDSTAKFQDFFNFSFAHAGFTSHHPPVMKYRERQFQFSAGYKDLEPCLLLLMGLIC